MLGRLANSTIIRFTVLALLLAFVCESHLGAQAAPESDPSVIVTTILGGQGQRFAGLVDGTLWFFTKGGLVKLDPQNQQFTSVPILEQVKHVGYAYGDSVVGGGSLWMYGKAHNVAGIHRVDLGTGKCVATVELKPLKGFNNLTYGDGSLWVLNEYDGNLVRIDPGTNEVAATIELGKGFWQNLKIADSSVWVMGLQNGVVKRVDAQSNKIVDEFSATKPQPGMGKNMLTALTHIYEGYGAGNEVADKQGTYFFSVGEGALWVADAKESGKYTVLRIDPKNHEPTAKIEIDNSTGAPVFWNGYAWVLRAGFSITRINPKTNLIAGKIALPYWNGGGYWHPDPGASVLLAGEDSLWAIGEATPKTHLVIRRIQQKPTVPIDDRK